MIERLKDTIYDYGEELRDLSYEEIEKKQKDSFTINANQLNDIAGLVNEKIKIADTFTHYIIEKCKPSHANILRRFVEDYERQIDLLKNGFLDEEELENLKMVTVAIDLLFEIDVSYYTKLREMFIEATIEKMYDYFEKNIDYELNYGDLCIVLNKKGYDNDDFGPRNPKTR